jgi:RNA polymerase sigma factor (sigma-70 family)
MDPRLPGISDEHLLVLYRQTTDRTYVDELYRRLSWSVFRVLRGRYKSREFAEDVLQDTFARIIENPHSYKESVPALPWLTRFALNVAHDAMRKANAGRRGGGQTIVSLQSSWDDENGTDVDPVDEHIWQSYSGWSPTNPARIVHYREKVAQLVRLLDRLPVLQRDIFKAFYFQGLSYKQITAMTGLTEAGVTSHLKRIRERLRKWHSVA